MKVIILFPFFSLFLGGCHNMDNQTKILEFQNEKKTAEFYFVNDTISKIVWFNSKTGKINGEKLYNKGIPNSNGNPDVEKDYLDYLDYLNTLKSYDISLKNKNAILFGSDLKDLATILSIGKENNDFIKKNIETEDSVTQILFKDFEKNIRFSPSLITLFIPANTVIKNYSLYIKYRQPIREVYQTSIGVLEKEYDYKREGNNISSIIYKIHENENNKIIFQKKFDYVIY